VADGPGRELLGGAIQVESDPELESAWFQLSNLKCDILVSKLCFFKCNLYRYNSAQVAAAATAAAAASSEARVANATAHARDAEAAAEAYSVELELLRGLIDEGFLPGGADGGKCWAEAGAVQLLNPVDP
jgi:hypothetical protein